MPEGFRRPVLIAVVLLLALGSLWNYRQDLRALFGPVAPKNSPASSPRPSAVPVPTAEPAWHPFIDPAEPAPPERSPYPLESLPILPHAKIAPLPPESPAANALLEAHLLKAAGPGPLGPELLLYPDPLPYLWAMAVLERTVKQRGFKTYFFTGQASSIRFAEQGYILLGLPELARLLSEAEQRFAEAYHQHAGHPANISDIDSRWRQHFNTADVYQRRHAYVMAHWLLFSPTLQPSDPPGDGDF